MSVDFEGTYIDKAALIIMHYQVDVFAILFGEQPSPLLDECNGLIRRWRGTGVVLSSVTWASDADYDVRLVRDCCYDPDQDAHEALFRSGFGGRVRVV
jgi:hypothetical protein